jgi:hypothetical protein
MAALTYNLKKYLKFISKKAISKAAAVQVEAETAFSTCFSALQAVFRQYKPVCLWR